MRFSLCSLLCITAIASLFIVDQVSTVLFALIVEVILIFGGVELLASQYASTQLREARSDNCQSNGWFDFSS